MSCYRRVKHFDEMIINTMFPGIIIFPIPERDKHLVKAIDSLNDCL